MKSMIRWSALTAVSALAISMATAPVAAGRITNTRDAGYENHRIVSQHAGGASETIAPWELEPYLPIFGETLIYGSSNLFPESGVLAVWTGSRWQDLPTTAYTFERGAMAQQGGPERFHTASWTLFRLTAAQTQALFNQYGSGIWLRFTIRPMPGPQDPGDVFEQLFLRRGNP